MVRRLPEAEFRDRPWRIHGYVDQFPRRGRVGRRRPWSAGGLSRLVDLIASTDTSESSSPAVRWMFAARWKLGEWLGWDDDSEGLGARVPTLRASLPTELRETVDPARFAALPFTALYELPDEFAAEIANKTMHGVMHLGAVPDGEGRITVQMSVLVRTNGLFGQAYMALIRPFRHLIVYPAMFGEMERRWAKQQVP